MSEMEILTWFGYLASVVTAASLLMSRPLRLRWLNLIGSALFAVYGVLIKAYPVGFFNGIIVLIDAYYIYKIYTASSNFSTMIVGQGDKILNFFINTYQYDIKKFFPHYMDAVEKNNFLALQMRDMEVCGMVIGERLGDELTVNIDYTSPNNRDYKPGFYLYNKSSVLKELGIKKLWSRPETQPHQEYLLKMGFKLDHNQFSKTLTA